MEEGRVWCLKDAIGAYFDTLERLLFRLTCNVIYNVSEVGFDDWVDATKWTIVVPIDYEGFTVPVPRNQSDSHAP
jgi:hypothetical protein